MNLVIESNAISRINTPAFADPQARTDERQIDRHSPPTISLDERGFIHECAKSVEALFGYRQHELLLQHISRLIPKLTEVSLMQGNRLNPLLNYICHCGHTFEAVNKHSDIIICNLNFFLVDHTGMANLRLIVRPVAAAKS